MYNSNNHFGVSEKEGLVWAKTSRLSSKERETVDQFLAFFCSGIAVRFRFQIFLFDRLLFGLTIVE